MEQAKVVLLSCGEMVYPREWLDKNILEVKTGLEKLDLQLVGAFTLFNEKAARDAVQNMEGLRFDTIIIHFVSWHITSTVMIVLKEYRNIPLLVWSTGGKTDTNGKLHSPAAPAAITALLPVLKEMNFKYKAIYEKPDSPYSYSAVENFCKVAGAYHRIRNSKIGLIGYADMGLYTCAYDRTALENKLGINVEDYFSYEIAKIMEDAPAKEIATIIDEMKRDLKFENSVSDLILEKVARLYYVLKHKVTENGLDAISIKCVYGVTRYMGVNPCMAQSLLANKDLSVICECDAHGLITNVMLSMLTGQAASFMENYEFFSDEILVGTCGFMPFDFADGPLKVRSSNLGDFFIGLSNVSKVKTGTMTIARLFKSGDSYKMFLTKGEARPPMKWIELGWEEPTPDFPSILLKLDMPVQRYMETVPGQHVILVYGDHVQQMMDLCNIMGIDVI